MKPHEETWEWDSERGTDRYSILQGEREGDVGEIGVFYNEGQARLATQAPAMARLLLRFASMTCPLCSSFDISKHFEGCALPTVLRDAGVIP